MPRKTSPLRGNNTSGVASPMLIIGSGMTTIENNQSLDRFQLEKIKENSPLRNKVQFGGKIISSKIMSSCCSPTVVNVKTHSPLRSNGTKNDGQRSPLRNKLPEEIMTNKRSNSPLRNRSNYVTSTSRQQVSNTVSVSIPDIKI